MPSIKEIVQIIHRERQEDPWFIEKASMLGALAFLMLMIWFAV